MQEICAAAQRFGNALCPEAVVGSREWKLRVWGFTAPCLLSDRPLYLFTFPRRKIRETKKKPHSIPAGRVPHPSHFKVSTLFLLSVVQASKLCCKTRIPGWMSTE